MSEGAPARRLGDRLVWLALGCWAALVALQLARSGPLAYQWAFGLWRYHPAYFGAVLGALALAACLAPVQRRVAAAAARLHGAATTLPPPALYALLFAGFTGLLWSCRTHDLYADSPLLVTARVAGWWFAFPEIGATYLMQWARELGLPFRVGPIFPIRLAVCLCGGLMLLLLLGAGRRLVPGPRGAAVATVYLLSGALVLLFAGHVEVYAFQLPAVAGYLWAALAYLDRRCGYWLPALALGVAVWLHAASLLLAPSLLFLHLLAQPDLRPAERLRIVSPALLVGAMPFLLFLGLEFTVGHREDLLRALDRAIEVLGGKSDPDAIRWWVRGWASYPSVGTDVIFLSPPHVKYLVNAFAMLVPSSVPVLVFFAVRRPGDLWATPLRRFLLAACLPLVAYAVALRPFWGPFDWDLFCLTGLMLGALAVNLLATELPQPLSRRVLVWLVAFHLCFVTLPFLVTGRVDGRVAGPYELWEGNFDLILPRTPPPDVLEPWL